MHCSTIMMSQLYGPCYIYFSQKVLANRGQVGVFLFDYLESGGSALENGTFRVDTADSYPRLTYVSSLFQ